VISTSQLMTLVRRNADFAPCFFQYQLLYLRLLRRFLLKPVESHSLLYRVTLGLLFCVLLVVSLYYAKGILVPVTAAALLAMLLLPLVRRFERWRFGKTFSIVASILVVIGFLSLLIYILSSQIVSFSADLPTIQQKLNERFSELQVWIGNITGLSGEEQLVYLQRSTSSMLGAAQSIAGKILIATTGTVVFIGLVIVLTFLFLYYRSRIRIFFLQVIPEEDHINTDEIIEEISHVTQKYLLGVFSVIGILSVLNSFVFFIIGVPHAIFFGILASILNVIPYLGVWIGTLLPMIMMAITQDSLTPIFLILIGVWINQQIDNNFLTPRITGSQVAINPLATIIILIVGGMIWGVAGLILFIPLLGVSKIVFDNIDGLKPLGHLIGEDKPRLIKRIRKANERRKSHSDEVR